MGVKITPQPFGRTPEGREVTSFELANANGMVVRILNYGGIIQAIEIPDRNGNVLDMVLGYDDLDGYLNDLSYQGALVGRYANRIVQARFTLDDISYAVDRNETSNCLHGGAQGFSKVLWDAQVLKINDDPVLRLDHTSPHGDQGFPGELRVSAEYVLNDLNELHIHLTALSDRKTVVSLTMHPYFNLSGDHGKTIEDHGLQLFDDCFLPITRDVVPSGEIWSVANTPFDFTESRVLGDVDWAGAEQLSLAQGLDHCFLTRNRNATLRTRAVLRHQPSGRQLALSSNAPGLQVYTANHLSPSVMGKKGEAFVPRAAICLEPQEFPNAPNEPRFPSAVLDAGQRYDHLLVFAFSEEA